MRISGIGAARLPRRTGSQRAGFSLVEVLVAIAVLTIGIIAFLEIFPGGILALQIAANVSAADRLAQGEVNQLSPGSGAQIQQVAAVESLYTDTDDNNTAMVQLDPNFNLDRAISQTSGLSTAYTATTPAANIATGFDIAPVSSNYAATPVGTALNPEPYEYISGERVSIPPPTAASITVATPQMPATGNAILSFGPFSLPKVGTTAYSYPDLNKFDSLDPNLHCSFFVHGLPWTSHPASSGAVTDAFGTVTPAPSGVSADDPESELKLNSPEYLIDYSNCAVALREPQELAPSAAAAAPYAQAFVFQVTVLHNGVPVQHTYLFAAQWPGATATGSPNPINFFDPTTNHSTWVTFLPYKDASGNIVTPAHDINNTTLADGDTFVPGTEKLVRDFKMVDKTQDFDADPYEFALPAFLDGTTATVQLGELEFNLLAGGISDTRGQPLQASVDYIVQDWRTLHEDRTVGDQANTGGSSMTSSTVRLTLKNMLKGGATDTNGVPYNGIAGLGNSSDVLVYDLDTFQPLTEGAATYGFTTDYANSAVTLTGVPTGSHIRIYYHAEDSWGLAVLKPAASYNVVTAAVNGSDSPATTGRAVLDAGTGGATALLYFPPCDIGRSVQIGGTLSYNDSSNVPHTVPLSLLTPLSASTGTFAVAPGVVDLTQAIQGGLPSGATITAANPTASGASITARAVWLQRGIWRSRDVTTVDLPTGN